MKFVENFASIAQPIIQFMCKDKKFVWTFECEAAALELKKCLTSTPVLALPNSKGNLRYFVMPPRKV